MPLSPVSDQEDLARFLVCSGWFSRNPQPRVKQDAFIATPYIELSVTRHIGLTEDQIWQAGEEVRAEREKTENRKVTLYGRGDIQAGQVRAEKLDVVPREPPRNHAEIVNWPSAKKSEQKSIAQKLANKAQAILLEVKK